MTLTRTPGYRAVAVGAAAAALLVGAFALGATRSSGATRSGGATSSAGPTRGSGTAPAASGPSAAPGLADAQLTASTGPARITVTGTGTVSGTPDQLVLSMGVQTSAGSVAAALQQADLAVSRVTGTLRRSGVAAADIQTSDLSIEPNYSNNSDTPDSYGVQESLTATLRMATAGSQISAAVRAGGNLTTVDGISLNLADDSALLAAARNAAVADAKVKAGQYARAIGEPLDGVVSISDQEQQVQTPLPVANGSAASRSAVPISPGSQQLSVSITVVFAAG
jgi:uncharacterized protein